MDRKSLIAAALCIILYIGWTQYLQRKYPDYGKPKEEPLPTETTVTSDDQSKKEQAAQTLEASNDQIAAATTPSIARLSREQLTIENEFISYQFDQDRAGFVAVTLKDYKASADKKEKSKVDLINSLFTIQSFPSFERTGVVSDYSAERTDRGMIFKRQQGPWQITQGYDFSDLDYGGRLTVTYKNTSDKLQELNSSVVIHEKIKLPEATGGLLPDVAGQQFSFVVGSEGSRDDENMRSYCEEEDMEPALSGKHEPLDFIGFDSHYFIKVLVANGQKFDYTVNKAAPVGKSSICDMTMTLNQAYGMIEAGKTVEVKFETYFGPKDPSRLAATSDNLRESLYLGWFGAIARPLLWVVKSINSFTGNFGLAIILLTICLKILFYPLTRAAAVSMKRMQQFTPELNRIKEKYKDDKQAQNREVMAFMSKHKINPAKGCLPILPQIPVFIAFYNVLSHSIELRHAPFFGWIQDLSAADPYYVTPILLGIGMMIQQKLTPNPTMDKTQARVMMMMPVMFTFMMLSLPAGMVLYMITNTIVSIAQQQWLNRRLDVKLAKAAS